MYVSVICFVGIHRVYSSSHSDVDNTEQPSAYHSRQLLEDSDDDNNGVSGPSGPSNHSRTNSKEFTNNNHQHSRGSQDREDHRKQGYRGSSGNFNTTNRLHQHISKENSGNGPVGTNSRNKKDLQRLPSELEEISLDNSTTVGNHYRGAASGGRKTEGVGSKTNSNGSMFSLAEVENDEDYDGAESGSNQFSNSPASHNHNNSNNNLTYSHDDEEERQAVGSRAGVAAAAEHVPFAASGERGSLKKMHAANMSIHIDSKDLGSTPPVVAKPSPTVGGKRAMPTSAPPKKALESLNQVEAVIQSADAAAGGSGKRLSIDELLYRKKVNNSAADSKQGSDDRRGGGSKQSSDDSEDEEVDFKVELYYS